MGAKEKTHHNSISPPRLFSFKQSREYLLYKKGEEKEK
jgi:hypothetical protein